MDPIREGRSKPPLAIPIAIPSPHALLNPKGLANGKPKEEDVKILPNSGNPQIASANGYSTVPEPQFAFTNSEGDYNDDEDTQDDHYKVVGQASLLARSQNTRDRPEQAAKRQKLSTNDDHNWVTSKGGSEVSQHFKQKRAEGAMNGHEAAKEIPTEPVDLTTNGSGDEVLEAGNDDAAKDKTKENQDMQEDDEEPEDPEVCIGQADVSFCLIFLLMLI